MSPLFIYCANVPVAATGDPCASKGTFHDKMVALCFELVGLQSRFKIEKVRLPVLVVYDLVAYLWGVSQLKLKDAKRKVTLSLCVVYQL